MLTTLYLHTEDGVEQGKQTSSLLILGQWDRLQPL